jgi:hypothetical protein
LFIILVVSLIFLFVNLNIYIGRQDWKYSRGEYIADFLNFSDTTYKLSGRRIYKNGVLVGRIYFCFGPTLVIKGSENNAIGYYSKK